MTTDETVPPHIAALSTALQPLIDEAEGLRADVHAAEDARRLSARYNIGLLAALVVGLVLVLVIGYQNNQLAAQVNKTNATLADCTVPGGKCYTASRAGTGRAIADLIRADAIVSECARQWPNESGAAYDAKLEACVYSRLAMPAGPVNPTPTASPSGTAKGGK